MHKIKRTLGFIFSHPLGKRRPFKSIFRFLLWQVQSSFSPSKFIAKPFVSPVKFYARKGLTGITGNIYTGLHEFIDMGFLLHFLREEDVFFDVGANVGSYSLLASGVCKAKSIAIEPIKKSFDILCSNIGLNNLQNKIQPINKGAGSREEKLAFTSGQDTTNHVYVGDDNDTVEADIITIDSIAQAIVPVLIKIDVEGYEVAVVKGMIETLKSPTLKAIIIELNGGGFRYGFDENAVHDLLLAAQFKAYNYDPFKRSLILLATYGSDNTIYCRDMDYVTGRLQNAAGIKIMGEVI